MVSKSLFLIVMIPVYSLLLLILLPFNFFFFLPFLLYRFLLTVLAPILNPALSAILTARSAIFTWDLTDPSKARLNLVIQFRLDTYLDREEVLRLFRDRVLPAKSPDGSLKYPELSQFLTRWGGYYFWQEDKSFDLSEHIKTVEFPSFNPSRDPLYDENDHQILTNFHEELLQTGWKRGKPIWEFFVVHLKSQEEGRRTVLFFRTHHTLGDGYSFLHLFTEDFAEKRFFPPTPISGLSGMSHFFLLLLNIPRAIYDLAFTLAHTTGPFTPRHLTMRDVRTEPNLSCSPNTLLMSTNPVPLSVSQIKAVRAHFQTSFSAVLSSILGGAVRDLLIHKGLEAPEELPVILPLPWKTKGGRLRNNNGSAVLRIPVEESDAVQRLQKCEAEHLRAKKTAEWITSPIGCQALGCVPTCFIKVLWESIRAISFLTSFPGGEVMHVGEGMVQCSELSFSVGLAANNTGLGFCTISYGDGLKVTAVSDTAHMSSNDLDFLTRQSSVHLAVLFELVNDQDCIR